MSAQLGFFGEDLEAVRSEDAIDATERALTAVESASGSPTVKIANDDEPVSVYEADIRKAMARGDRTFTVFRDEIACVTCKIGEAYHRDTFPCESRDAYLLKCQERFEREKIDVALGGRAYPPTIYEQNVDSEYYENGWGRYVTLRVEFYSPKSCIDSPKWVPLDMNHNGRSYLSYPCAFSRVDDHPLKDAKWFVEVARQEICNFDFLGYPTVKPEYDAMLRAARLARSASRDFGADDVDEGDGMESDERDLGVNSETSLRPTIRQAAKQRSKSIAIGLGL